MSIGVHMSLSVLVFSVCMPSMGLLGHMAVLFPGFYHDTILKFSTEFSASVEMIM